MVSNPTHGSGWFIQWFLNPTHGSGWFIQILSTRNSIGPLNPTNGSWWIVQILSKGSEISTHCRGWDYISFGDVSVEDLKRTTHCRGWDYISFGEVL